MYANRLLLKEIKNLWKAGLKSILGLCTTYNGLFKRNYLKSGSEWL